MDFLEQLLGFSSDGGSGALELVLFLLPAAGCLYLGYRRMFAMRRR